MNSISGLKICGVDCILSAEWKSSSKIIARTGQGKGKGDIIVTTRAGGTGTCTVGFRGYFIQIGKGLFHTRFSSNFPGIFGETDKEGIWVFDDN